MNRNDGNREIRIVLAGVAAIAAVALTVGLIMLPPVVGMADSGDFGRVLGVSGFRILHPERSYEELYFHYAQQHFGYGGYRLGGYVSTHVVLAAVVGWIGRAINGDVFDIRVLGACYALLFGGAVMLFVRYAPEAGSRAKSAALAVVTAASLMFVFGDIGYLAYFQSFFGEPYALVAMLLTVAASLALASSDRPSGLLLALFVGSALAVATSKIQNAPLGFAFALLAWRMLALRRDRRWRRQAKTGAALLVVVTVLMIVVAPDRLKHVNLYQSIFYGVLKDSPNVERDMEELGIPERYAVLAGTNYFQKGTAIPQNDPVLHREVLGQLSHKDIASYYLSHPSRFLQKLERAADNAMYIRPYYLGNYDLSAGKPPGALKQAYGVWSDFKVGYMPRTAWAYFGIFAAYAAGLLLVWIRSAGGDDSPPRRWRSSPWPARSLARCLCSETGRPIWGKHLFMFNVCFDLMTVSAVVGGLYGVIWLSERKARQQKTTLFSGR